MGVAVSEASQLQRARRPSPSTREVLPMIATELAAHVATVLHAGSTLAEPAPKGIDTENIVSFFASNIAPILLAILGVIFIGRASRGEISKVLTSSAIAIVGLAFIAGAATLFFVGDYIINLIFS
jgi:type IV secretory pathway VirB2 component (pilin)